MGNNSTPTPRAWPRFPPRTAAFDAHWATKILGNPAAVKQTILVDGQVAGNMGRWPQDGVRLDGYWIDKEYWGKGVATRALAAFLHVVTERPLHAHVAKHNVRSIRVLEKCGFSLEREESARGRRQRRRRARARPGVRTGISDGPGGLLRRVSTWINLSAKGCNGIQWFPRS